MPRSSVRRPRAAQRVVIEEWEVKFPDPETGQLMAFDVFCARGTFFDELPRVLIGLGYSPDQFDVNGQGTSWSRQQRHQHR